MVGLVYAAPLGVDRENSDLIFFTSLATTGPPAWVVLPIVFVVVAAVLYGPGFLVGQCFFELPRLTAYRYDLIGSLVGITAFTGLSFLGAASLVWGVVVAVLVITLYWPARSRAAAGEAAPFPATTRMGLVLACLGRGARRHPGQGVRPAGRPVVALLQARDPDPDDDDRRVHHDHRQRGAPPGGD